LNQNLKHWLSAFLLCGLGFLGAIAGQGLMPAIAVDPNLQPLPPLQQHPLPTSLAAPFKSASQGDYFDQVKPMEVGYLIWSRFPVQVYLQPPEINADTWLQIAQQAIKDWQSYLPLALVTQPEEADILVLGQPPAQRSQGRVRSAETTYALYVDTRGRLDHRCTVRVRPNQIPKYLLAALRHELGHALGIWGHSPLETDALYFSQVRNPPLISARDVNTLRRVYQQPTRLGWPVAQSKTSNS
jgi:predicted Zn-dependent protease